MKWKIIIAVIAIIIAIIIGFFLILQKPEYPEIDTPQQWKGNLQAKVFVEEFSDFQCPACIGIQPYIEAIFQQFKDSIKFSYRHFPLSSHNFSKKAAEASVCAADFNKFWEYHNELFKLNGKLDNQSLINAAKKIGINEQEFSNCLYSGKKAVIVEKDITEGQNLGVNGTPSFFVNGEKIEGIYLSEILKNLKTKIQEKISEVNQ